MFLEQLFRLKNSDRKSRRTRSLAKSPSKVSRKSLESPSKKSQRQVEKIEDKIRQMIQENNLITRNEFAEECGISEKTVTRYIKKIKEFIYMGKGKNGCWIKVNDENSIKKLRNSF